jgi:secondary thiamine-phosphate synthase enzyme
MEMEIKSYEIAFSTTGHCDIVDITAAVSDKVDEGRLLDGQVHLFVPGSTAALTTIEYEGGVLRDLKEAIERLAPEGLRYHHDARWGDGNGHAHVRAALIGAALTIPVIRGALCLGTWQQIVLVDFDNRPRKRRVILQLCGTKG